VPRCRATIEKYRFVDVSREPVDDDTAHSGDAVLRGELSPLRNATLQAGPGAAGQQRGAPPTAQLT
jgi:hypothetical protein